MGTLTCRCGNYIRTDTEESAGDTAGFLTAKGWCMLRDEVRGNIHALAAAVAAGQTPAQWADVSMESKEAEEALLLYCFFESAFIEHGRSMYQCEVCSRLYVETGTRHCFRSFLPESDDSQGILGDATAAAR